MFNQMKRTGIILFFFFLTAIFTFPLILKFKSYIAAFHGTDEPYGILWHFWWLKYSYLHHLDSYFSYFIMSPFGINLAQSPIYPVGDFIDRFLALGFGEIAAYNIQIFVSFILSGIFMYYLVYRLAKNKMAALCSAIIYAFCPYHSVRSWQHPSLAQIQWFPLYALSLCGLKEEASLKNIIFSALSFCLIVFFNYYYAYFAVILTVTFMVFIFMSQKKTGIVTIKSTALSLAVALFVLLPIIFPIFRTFAFSGNSGDLAIGGYLRPFKDFFEQSARPLSYFLPSAEHPIAGKFTEKIIGSPLYGASFTEHTLYLGWAPLVLAFVAFRRWKKNKKSNLTAKEYFYIGFFLSLAFIAWLFSQQPWWQIGRFKLYMPSFFMYKIAPMFRANCRFGILVMMAVAVLAGFGLKFILDKVKTQKAKFALTVLFSGLVLFEFWNYPPFKVIDLSSVPQVYYWLKDEPGDFLIAEYPLDVDGANETYKFFQTRHEKKIINGSAPGTYANSLARDIKRLSDAGTAGILKWMGVKYILVHKEGYLNTDLIEDREELDMINKNPGLRLIKVFPPQECPQDNLSCLQKTGQVDVYELEAPFTKPGVK